MARVIDTREMNENVFGEDTPVYMVAVDAETYEEAKEKAIEQYKAYLREKQEQMRNTNDELMQLFAGLY